MPNTQVVRIVQSIGEIEPAQWDACANPEAGEAGDGDANKGDVRGERFNPFLTHAFLLALEASKSVGGRTGWAPTHVVLENAAGRLTAAAPCYIKTHSMGEYVFDHAWADAYHRAGLDYYPKLQVCVPFTPATGRRLLVSREAGPLALPTLIAGLKAWRAKVEASSIHVTFATEPQWAAMGAEGFLQRTGQQFHFVNEGYADFEGFLDDLASRKRKMIRRERRDALGPGITIECLRGDAIKAEHWKAFFDFYVDTGSRKWGRPYLTRPFFDAIGRTMADRVLLVMAKREGRYIAGAINFIGDDALYGRNWGCTRGAPLPALRGLLLPGDRLRDRRAAWRASRRGRRASTSSPAATAPSPPVPAHFIADPRFARAIDDYLTRERAAIDEAIEDYGALVPFKKVAS